MANAQYRLDDDAYQILLRHKGVSVTLSDAVRNMENKLNLLQSVTPHDTRVTQPVTKQSWIEKSQQALSDKGGRAIGSLDEKEFWKDLKKEVEGIITQYAGR